MLIFIEFYLEGVHRPLTNFYKKFRDKTAGVNFIQTDKLLIILEKLVLNENIKDENKRKGFRIDFKN